MSGLIVLIGENPQAHEALIQSLKFDGYSVLPVRTLPEALTHLRNQAFTVAAVISNVGMRRQQDLDTMLEICATRPHLPLILAVNELHDLHSEFRTSIRGLHILETPLTHRDSHQAIREVIDSVWLSGAQNKNQGEVLDTDSDQRTRVLTSDMANSEVQHYSESFLSRVGMADVPVLLHGETGVGKEVMARRLCAYSSRANKPFLKLNCAALPSELIESELFGYEKGAFTGATIDKPGKFELAQGGTILLDEIGDMDIRLQAKLLQVLQDGEVQPLGSRRIVKVDVRVMAATHRDLRRGIEEGAFREDLYYRLNVINIVIPPLRERQQEILPLAEMLLRRHLPSGTTAPVITRELQSAMLNYDWPGNVRELENVMRRYLVYQDADLLIQELVRLNSGPSTAHEAKVPEHRHSNGNLLTMDHLEQNSRKAETKLLLEALGATRWNRRQAAAQLNIDYKAFLYKLQKYGIVETKAKRGEVGA
ncbi:MAG TPA: sigma-54 dependent transcriptional regulator [Silvibacterium sp.]|nr:sigma-54 dependent transcriptional regulator [Silvibacterium sp.]